MNSTIQNLAVEYAQDGIRFNGGAPGVVNTPMHPDDPTELGAAEMGNNTLNDASMVAGTYTDSSGRQHGYTAVATAQ